MIALIMAGGIGTRFWPMSKASKPKQFLSILSEKSMIQMTVERLLEKIKMKDIYVVTAASQTALVEEHLPKLPKENIISEPFGMNTAPCIALSALYLRKKYQNDETMFVLPADHLIQNVEEFQRTLSVGEKAAKLENLVTFGIKPTYPATGYGYIESGEKNQNEMYEVARFKEKPDVTTAEKFIKAGNFFWNSGMFMWKISTILDAYQQFLPDVTLLLNEIEKKWDQTVTDIAEIYKKMPKLPVDIGIMEKTKKRIVIPVDYGWSDVGGWKALYDISKKDKNDNVIKADTILIDSKKNYINAQKKVALIGIDDVIIVETDDAILISKKDRSEEVKKIANLSPK